MIEWDRSNGRRCTALYGRGCRTTLGVYSGGMAVAENERRRIVAAVVAAALRAEAEEEAHSVVCSDGESCRWEGPDIMVGAVIGGEVEMVYADPRALVDLVLDTLVVGGVGLDATGVPTAACPNCGDTWLKVPMMFDADTYEPSMWGTVGECYSCGTRLTVCTPPDKETYDNGSDNGSGD